MKKFKSILAIITCFFLGHKKGIVETEHTFGVGCIRCKCTNGHVYWKTKGVIRRMGEIDEETAERIKQHEQYLEFIYDKLLKGKTLKEAEDLWFKIISIW